MYNMSENMNTWKQWGMWLERMCSHKPLKINISSLFLGKESDGYVKYPKYITTIYILLMSIQM